MKNNMLLIGALLGASLAEGVVVPGFKIQAFEKDSGCQGDVQKEVFVPSSLCSSDFLSSIGNNAVGSASYNYVVSGNDVTVAFALFREAGCAGTPAFEQSTTISAWWADALNGCLTTQGFDFKAVEASLDTKDIFTRIVVAGKKCSDLKVNFEAEGYMQAVMTSNTNLLGSLTGSISLSLNNNFGNEAIISGSCQVTASGSSSFNVDGEGNVSWFASADCTGEVQSNLKCFDDVGGATVVGSVEDVQSTGSAGNDSTSLTKATSLFLSTILARVFMQ